MEGTEDHRESKEDKGKTATEKAEQQSFINNQSPPPHNRKPGPRSLRTLLLTATRMLYAILFAAGGNIL